MSAELPGAHPPKRGVHMNSTQKQCLLKYLGYYTGAVDGIWGSASAAALEAFRSASGSAGSDADLTAAVAASETEAAEARDTEKAGFWAGIRYFTREEFRCKCGGLYCSGFPAEPSEQLVTLADGLRAHFDAPVTVSSGLRCPKHNAAVGGVANSRHLAGKAMDFSVRGRSAAEVCSYAAALPGIRYAYAIDGSYVHMDVA